MTEATLAAARSLAQAELSRLADTVIADLRLIPPCGIFPDTACRHFWDELAFDQQEGPYDDVSEAIEDTLHPILIAHIKTSRRRYSPSSAPTLPNWTAIPTATCLRGPSGRTASPTP